MGCTTRLQVSDCFYDHWKMCRGAYWATDSIEWRNSRVWINMSRTPGTCPGGTRKRISYKGTAIFNEFTVKVIGLTEGSVTIEVWRTSELEPSEPDNGFGFGRAEITQTNINNGLMFNVGSHIECSLRVMNTGEDGKIYGAVGLGYHDTEGAVFFTGRYMIDDVKISSGEMFTWNPSIEVLHKDYAAREMTTRGPAVYFMSGHEENGNVVWDRSEYIPVNLELESGYVDPTDPGGVPDDWPEPIPGEPAKPEDSGFWGVIFTMPDIKKWIYKSIKGYITP